MRVYYNEIDAYCVQWLKNLMDAAEIPTGDIDTRSIEDVTPNDLRDYDQCHFFAGIGGWAYALKLADWGDRKVWTGSCPCQPFSSAGKGAGFEDERHLWPAFHHLIAQQRPSVVFGEQVASKDAEPWIDLVQTDLEGVGYRVGAVPFPSAGVGAPHIRDRLYWMADATSVGFKGGRSGKARDGRDSTRLEPERLRNAGGMADADGRQQQGITVVRWLERDGQDARRPEGGGEPESRREVCGEQLGPTNGFWRSADWLGCQDGKFRPVESGTFPLAHGLSGRVGRLRAYGNAINPWQAAEFIAAYAESRGLSHA